MVAVLIFVACVGGLIFFFSHQVVRFTRDLPNLQEKFASRLQVARDWISETYNIEDSVQSNYLDKSTAGLAENAVNSIATTFVGMIRIVLLMIFFFIFTFFILYYRKLLLEFLFALFNQQHRDRVRTVVLEVHGVINNYVLGLLIEMIILGSLIFAALGIMGIRYALLISVMAGVFNIIPYIGIYTALFFSAMITLANGSGAQAIELIIVFIAVHFVDANIILPRIVGGRVKLNPMITIVAVLIGNLLWGIPGMFLFIPLTAIIRIISQEVNELKPWSILLGEARRK
jgi:predicted PurR-regulated permease PerM